MRLTNSDEPVRRALNKTRRSGGLSAEQAAASSRINLQKNAQPTITAPALVFTAKSMGVVFVVCTMTTYSHAAASMNASQRNDG